MSRGGSCLVVTLVSVLAACGTDDAGMPAGDAPDGGGPGDTLVPDPPVLPTPPVLTPCPEGWREVTNAAGVVECDPWPATGHADCADDEAHFVGEPGCARIGPACPEDGFPEGLPSDRAIVYVREGATAGDGSREAPFGSIAQGIRAVAASGGIVAIASGRYDEWVKVSHGITLWGACVAGTVLTSSVSAPTNRIGVVTALGPDIRVKSLSIDTPERAGLSVRAGATLDVEDVVVRSPWGVGMMAVDGGRLTGRSIAIRASRPRIDRWTAGIVVLSSASAELERIALESNRGANVQVWGRGSTLVMRRAAIRGARGTGVDRFLGLGVDVFAGATASLRASCIEDNDATAVVVNDRSTLTLEDVVVRDNTGRGLDPGGGVAIVDHASATIRRTVVAHNPSAGVFGQWDAMVDLEDVVVRDTVDLDAAHTAPGESGFGDGVRMQFECLLRVKRALLDHNHTTGVAVISSRAELEDVAAQHTMLPRIIPPLDDTHYFFGTGLDAIGASQVRVARMLSSGNAGSGMRLAFPGTTFDAQDVTIVDTTHGDPTDADGRVLSIEDGAAATIARLHMAGNHGSALGVGREATLDLTDARIEDTLPIEASGVAGRAIEVAFAARANIRRTVVDGAYETAVIVMNLPLSGGVGADATFEDFEIHDVRGAACAADGRCADAAGTGVVVFEASARLTRFVIDRTDLCGVQVAPGALVDLSQGRVAHTSVGACVQSDGYDLMRLTDRVVYEDNGVNISATAFYVPEPSTSDAFGAL